MSKLKWNGDADLANQNYGENYGIDWRYVSKESSSIIVDGKTIEVGQEM